ncbi:MAG: hypothetical protein ACOZD0_12630 [Pseudomonadota bacterium]
MNAAHARRPALSTRLLPCVLCAVALHAAALGWLVQGTSRPGGDGGAPGMQTGSGPALPRAAAMRVALRTRAAPAEPPAQTASRHAAALAATGLVSSVAADARTASPMTTAASTAADAADPAARPVAAQQAGGPTLGGPDAEGYVPRPLLTTAPEPVREIALPFPLDFAQRGRFAGILTLYIEADGRVSRVVVEGTSLPPLLARVAQQAFSGTRFTPGKVARRIVKSRIRVEVVFENPSSA